MKFGGQIRNIDVNFRSDRPLAHVQSTGACIRVYLRLYLPYNSLGVLLA